MIKKQAVNESWIIAPDLPNARFIVFYPESRAINSSGGGGGGGGGEGSKSLFYFTDRSPPKPCDGTREEQKQKEEEEEEEEEEGGSRRVLNLKVKPPPLLPNPRAEKSRLPPGSLEPFNRFKWGEEASLSSLPPPSLFPSACFKIRRGGFNDSPTLRWHWILSRSTSFSSPQNLPTPLSDLGRRRQRTIRFQNFFPLRFRHFVLSNVINGTTLLSCCCCCKIKRGGLIFEYYFILTIFSICIKLLRMLSKNLWRFIKFVVVVAKLKGEN